MASRSDDAASAQHETPARNKSSKSGRGSNKTNTPPQTPGVSTPAFASSSANLSSSSIPTPPSSGRSTAQANRHHRRPSAVLRAARAFLSSPPAPLSPPAAPSPPTSPPTVPRRMIWTSTSATSTATSSSSLPAATAPAAIMPSTPRIPREETPEVSQIPTNQACACCDNDDPDGSGKGKQHLSTSGQSQAAVQCAVHGDSRSAQSVQPAPTSIQPPRERDSGSMTKVEAQLQAAKAYMMRRRGQGSISEGGSSQDKKQKVMGQQR